MSNCTNPPVSEEVNPTVRGNNLAAFTLAEVLITLGIIGVVAAVTMPTLIANYKNQQTVAQLKKFYSVFSQAIQRSIVDNGDVADWDVTGTTVDDSVLFFDTYLKPYLKIVKECGKDTGCFASENYYMNSPGTAIDLDSDNFAKYILSDGYAISMYFGASALHIYVDLNGHKKPNTRGKDIFEFWLIPSNKKNYFVPKGYNEDYDLNLSDCKSSGYRCAAVIMMDGWQIKY